MDHEVHGWQTADRVLERILEGGRDGYGDAVVVAHKDTPPDFQGEVTAAVENRQQRDLRAQFEDGVRHVESGRSEARQMAECRWQIGVIYRALEGLPWKAHPRNTSSPTRSTVVNAK